jgi:predicted naringenin-chalcone synthase
MRLGLFWRTPQDLGRRRPDPNVLLICVLKCALHYHHYTMSREMVEQRMLVNTF